MNGERLPVPVESASSRPPRGASDDCAGYPRTLSSGGAGGRNRGSEGSPSQTPCWLSSDWTGVADSRGSWASSHPVHVHPTIHAVSTTASGSFRCTEVLTGYTPSEGGLLVEGSARIKAKGGQPPRPYRIVRSPARIGCNLRRLIRSHDGAPPFQNQRDDESAERRSSLSSRGCPATGLLAYNALHQIALAGPGNQA